MDFFVFGICVILKARRSQISVFKKVNIEFVWVVEDMDNCPHPDVKLSSFVQQRLLDVLLNNPLRITWLLVYKA